MEKQIHGASFRGLRVLIIKSNIFWDITPYVLVVTDIFVMLRSFQTSVNLFTIRHGLPHLTHKNRIFINSAVRTSNVTLY